MNVDSFILLSMAFTVMFHCSYVRFLRVGFSNLNNTKETPPLLVYKHTLLPVLGSTLMNSLASLIRASWPE